ncbi:MAG: glycosyltransferase [Myxococcota bacterium]|nr:glycosyltransferase [Myxococcota bacterium]
MTGPRVCLAISSFRNDEPVRRLVEAALADGSPFERIFVVDSLGTGAIDGSVRARWGDRVSFLCAEENLGSAGNLAKRLELAAEAGFDYVYALNHDGAVDFANVRELLRFVGTRPRIGAAYPLRWLARRGRYDITGAQSLPLPLRSAEAVDSDTPLRVTWSSSNGALYSLAPVREGLLPWADLWMGWEDMGYGWLLDRNGWEQYIVPSARADDDYEYSTHRFLGRTLHLADKPAWYAYYQIRNLILITRRNERPRLDRAVVAMRLAQELTLTAAFRSQKALRYRLLASGLVDGLRNRSGKWRLP